MLTSAAGIEHLLEGLEVRYLANRDPCLHFALLTDFVDAAAETLPGDAELVRLAREGIERLNEKYADVRADIFLSLSPCAPLERPGRRLDGLRAEARQAGRSERHAARRARTVSRRSSARPRSCTGVRYVITLDTDTQLPRDAARLMVGTLAHPLNRPVFDARRPPRRRWLYHSAAAGRRQPAQRAAVAVRATVCGRSGRRSVHARRLGRVPGSVWRRLVHRQGNLRRRFLRAAAAATFPRTRSSATT